MKKILLTSLLFYSNLLFSEQVFKTDIPNIVVKNFVCHDTHSWASFNLVNRSDNAVWGITILIIDKEGDILDSKSAELVAVPPKSGRELQITNLNCETVRKNKISFSAKLGN